MKCNKFVMLSDAVGKSVRGTMYECSMSDCEWIMSGGYPWQVK